MAIKGFDKAYYLGAKLDQLQNDPATAAEWAGKDVAFLEEKLINDFGLTAESHYEQYGYQEGLAPNAFFDSAEYIRAKAVQMVNDTSTTYTNVAEAETAFVEIWGGNVYLHYLEFGEKENVNPSNDFDVSSYLDAKLAALQADPETAEEWAGKTTADLTANFETANLTALEHFLAYGQDEEGLEAPAVPADERVEVDAQNPGQVFSLTADTDDLTGTENDDTFEGQTGLAGERTLNADDSLDGGEGNDTLTVAMDEGSFTGFSDDGGLTSVERVELTNESSFSRTFNAEGIEGVETYSVDAGNRDFTLNNVGETGLTFELSQSQRSFTVNADGDAFDGEDDAMALQLNGVGSEDNTVAVNMADIEELSVVANGDNYVDLSGVSEAESISVSGQGSLEIAGLSGNVTTFDAAELASGVEVDLSREGTLETVNGGAGDDVITVGANTNRDTVINGGNGNNTVNVTDATGTLRATFTNVQTLGFDALNGEVTLFGESVDALQTVNLGQTGENVTLREMGSDALTLNLQADAQNSAAVFDNTFTTDGSGLATLNTVAHAEDDADFGGTFNLRSAEQVALNVAEDTTFDGTINAAAAESVQIDATGQLASGAAVNAAAAQAATINVAEQEGDVASTLAIDAGNLERLTVTAGEQLTLTGVAADLDSLVRLDVTTEEAFDISNFDLASLAEANLSGAGSAEFNAGIGAASESVTINAGELYGDNGASTALDVDIAQLGDGSELGIAQVVGSTEGGNNVDVTGRDLTFTGGYGDDVVSLSNAGDADDLASFSIDTGVDGSGDEVTLSSVIGQGSISGDTAKVTIDGSSRVVTDDYVALTGAAKHGTVGIEGGEVVIAADGSVTLNGDVALNASGTYGAAFFSRDIGDSEWELDDTGFAGTFDFDVTVVNDEAKTWEALLFQNGAGDLFYVMDTVTAAGIDAGADSFRIVEVGIGWADDDSAQTAAEVTSYIEDNGLELIGVGMTTLTADYASA